MKTTKMDVPWGGKVPQFVGGGGDSIKHTTVELAKFHFSGRCPVHRGNGERCGANQQADAILELIQAGAQEGELQGGPGGALKGGLLGLALGAWLNSLD